MSVDHDYAVDELLRQLSACREALNDAKAMQRAFFNRLRIAVVIHDATNDMVSSNEAARQLFGLTEEQMSLTKAMDPAWTFTREDGQPMPTEEHPVNIVFRTGKPLEDYVVGIERPDKKETVWVSVNAAPALDGEGTVSQVIVAFVDLSKRKRTEDRLRLLSEKDPLTGIPNRRLFSQILDREWRLAVRYKLPISLVMIDIDFFKAYNDNYGHLAGDDCLVRVSRALSETLKRPTDYLARYGGEEFVLLLQNTDSEGAAHIAEDLRNSVESLQIPHARSPTTRCVTISLGVAEITPGTEHQVSELLLAADKALYRAKLVGKNQVITLEH